MDINKQKIRFGEKQFASSSLFNTFSSEIWNDFKNVYSDLFSNGILNEQQFLISVTEVGAPSYISVSHGIGYYNGNRICIPMNEEIPYDATRPFDPNFPGSTGNIYIPIPNRDIKYYVWIRHIWVVDKNSTGINKYGGIIYYKWDNGYKIVTSTSPTAPEPGYLLIGTVIIRSDNTYSIGYAGRPYMQLNIPVYSIDYKNSCFATTTTELSASYDDSTQTLIANNNGFLEVDGVIPDVGQRILVKNQITDPEHNGIYVVLNKGSQSTRWILQRSPDANSSSLVTNGMYTLIGSGLTQANSGWILTTPDPIILDTTPLYFALYSVKPIIGTGGISQLTYWTDIDKISGIQQLTWLSGSNILTLTSGTFQVINNNPNSFAGIFSGTLSTNKFRLSTTPTTGSLLYSTNSLGDASWASELLWDNNDAKLKVPTLEVTSQIQITGNGYGFGPWQIPTIDFNTFYSSWSDGIIANVTECPPDNSTQLCIKINGSVKILQTIDFI